MTEIRSMNVGASSRRFLDIYQDQAASSQMLRTPARQSRPKRGLRKIGDIDIYYLPIEDVEIYHAAPIRQRVAAWILDMTFLSSIVAMIALPFEIFVYLSGAEPSSWSVFLSRFVPGVLGLYFYIVRPPLHSGQTLGKKLMGISVVNLGYDGQLRIFQVLLREILWKSISVATFMFGFLVALVNPQFRALHDFGAQTRVISYRE